MLKGAQLVNGEPGAPPSPPVGGTGELFCPAAKRATRNLTKPGVLLTSHSAAVHMSAHQEPRAGVCLCSSLKTVPKLACRKQRSETQVLVTRTLQKRAVWLAAL